MNTTVKTTALITLITIIWGTTWMAIKVGLDGVSPLFGAGLRFLVAGTVLWLIARYRSTTPEFRTRDLRHVLILGVFMFSIPYGLVYWGEQYIPSSLASILFSAMPFWVLFFAHLMVAEEPFRWTEGIGSILGFLGVIVIFSEGAFNLKNAFSLGMIAVLGSTACSGFASVWGKRYNQEIHPFQTTAYAMMLGSLLLLLFSRFEAQRYFIPNALTVGSILYLGVFGSAITFSVYFWLMHHVKIVKLRFITFLSPLVAIFSGWLFLNETLSTRIFLGAALIFFGIFFADMLRYTKKYRKIPT